MWMLPLYLHVNKKSDDDGDDDDDDVLTEMPLMSTHNLYFMENKKIIPELSQNSSPSQVPCINNAHAQDNF